MAESHRQSISTAPDCHARGSLGPLLGLFPWDGESSASPLLGNEAEQLSDPGSCLLSTSSHLDLPEASSQARRAEQSSYGYDVAFEHISQSSHEPLDQGDPRESSRGYEMAAATEQRVVHPFQRLASAEPEQQPWSALHLGKPPTPSRTVRLTQPFSTNYSVASSGQPTSTLASPVNLTDDGYFTLSHPDRYSICSADSTQLHHTELEYSSTPRTMPSVPTQPEPITSHTELLRTINMQTPETMQHRSTRRAQPKALKCGEGACDFTCTTMSDFKKHLARHERKFVCKEASCPRLGKGFPTINDLHRHQRTVHEMELTHDRSQLYKCFSPHCRQADKEFRRFDNFKQHVCRVHRNESSEYLIRRSKEWLEADRRSLPRLSISGPETRPQAYAPSPAPLPGTSLCLQSQDLLSPTWQRSLDDPRQGHAETSNRHRRCSLTSQPNAPGHTSPPATSFPLRSPSQVPRLDENSRPDNVPAFASQFQRSSGLGFHLNPQQQRGRPGPAFTLPNPDVPALSELPDTDHPPYALLTPARSDLAQIAANFDPDQQPLFPGPDHEFLPASLSDPGQMPSQPSFSTWEGVEALIDSGDVGSNHDSSLFIEPVMRTGSPDVRESQLFSASTATIMSPAPSTRPSHPDLGDGRLQYSCSKSGCKKTFVRKCEQKKHLKRHRRLYGCTFSGCFDKFGSKYDWRRHENSLHFQQECWKCDQCSNDHDENRTGPPPAQLFYKRHLFAQHLETAHSLHPDMVRERMRTQRIGRNCQTAFWCGFCDKIIRLQGRGLDGVDERFNHIAEHFGKGEEISRWIEVGRNVQKGTTDVEQAGREEESEDAENLLDQDWILRSGQGRSIDQPGSQEDSGVIDTGQDAARNPFYHSEVAGSSPLPATDRAPKRQRPNEEQRGIHTKPPSRAAAGAMSPVVYCHECGNGPVLLEHTSQCVSCNHIWCGLCKWSSVKKETQY